jgi:hypothetical protein
MGPRRVLDTKTYWLTDRQSQYDFDFDFESTVSGSLAIAKSSEVQPLWVELYWVHGSDYGISNCDTADGSN